MHIEKVFLVDDDPAIRRIASLSLSRVGQWEVITADSGAKFLELFEETRPDVILMDVMMPDMDGLSTLKRMQSIETSHKTPVIFMTAKVLRDEVERYIKLGATGVISKPFDPMTLPKEIVDLVQGIN
jgi:CheY-like chemotaxis protein